MKNEGSGGSVRLTALDGNGTMKGMQRSVAYAYMPDREPPETPCALVIT